MSLSCCGTRKNLRAYFPRFFRPLPLALVASPATGGAPIAPPESVLCFLSCRPKKGRPPAGTGTNEFRSECWFQSASYIIADSTTVLFYPWLTKVDNLKSEFKLQQLRYRAVFTRVTICTASCTHCPRAQPARQIGI